MRLAVMAQYDPRGVLAPHVRRQVESLADAVDDLVVVSTSELTDASRTFLRDRARLVERDNTGYDFWSYRTGLEQQDLAAYDEVTLTNDSYVPVGPLRAVFDTMAARPAGFWGLTETDRIRHHVQSFLVTFRRPVLESEAFARFWTDLEALDDRSAVIRRHEVGLSRRLYRAGFASAAYFTETEEDRRLARRRVRWWALRRTGSPRSRADLALLRKRSRVPWNPSSGLADRVLQPGPEGAVRLPYAKVAILRHDPYGLDAARLLDLAEARHPEAFEGVRAHLADTARFYPPRPGDSLRPVPPWARPLRRWVEYGRT